MAQNKELLTLTRKQADSADLSALTLVEDSRPFVLPQQELSITIHDISGHWVVQISLWNYGNSVALLDPPPDRYPKLSLFRYDGYVIKANLDTIVIPKDTKSMSTFEANQWNAVRESQLPLGLGKETYYGAILEYWFTDSFSRNHYATKVFFTSEDTTSSSLESVAILKLVSSAKIRIDV